MKNVNLLKVICPLVPFLVTYSLFSNSLFYKEDYNLTPSEQAGQPIFTQDKEYIPWLVGTLLTPSGYAVPFPHIKIQPRIIVFHNHGQYDHNWDAHHTPGFLTVASHVLFEIGLTQFMNISLRPEVLYRHTDGASQTGFGDFVVGFDFQLYKYKKGSPFPSIKLILREFFPTGKYQHLDPNQLGTDQRGNGAYNTEVGLGFSHLYPLSKHHFIEARAGIIYRVPSAVHVKGFNTYGGEKDTNGTVYPGQVVFVSLGLQYSLNQRWVLAMDTLYRHDNATRFTGKKGIQASGAPANIGGNSSEQFILAPELQYNWSADLGIVAAPWFTFAGRNTGQFNGGIILFRYYH